MQEWRNWQTRRLQVPVVARSCGFKSHLLHSFLFQVYIKASQSLDFARLLLFSIFRHVSDYSKNLPPFCPSLFLDKKASLIYSKDYFSPADGYLPEFLLIIISSNCNQIFPCVLSACSIYHQYSISGLLVLGQCVDRIFICFSRKCQGFSIFSLKSSGNQNLLQ